jgi:hypothetical protein
MAAAKPATDPIADISRCIRTFRDCLTSLGSTANTALGGLAAVAPQRDVARGLGEVSVGSAYLLGSSDSQQALGLRPGDIVHCRCFCFSHISTQSMPTRMSANKVSPAKSIINARGG